MIEMAWIVGLLLILFNGCVMLAMLRSPDYGPGQKAAQSVLIWLLPVVGAALVLWFLRNGTAETPWHSTDFIPQERHGTGGG